MDPQLEMLVFIVEAIQFTIVSKRKLRSGKTMLMNELILLLRNNFFSS